MTAKEELEYIINSLTPQELETAIKVFQAHSLMIQEVQRPRFQIDRTQNPTIPA